MATRCSRAIIHRRDVSRGSYLKDKLCSDLKVSVAGWSLITHKTNTTRYKTIKSREKTVGTVEMVETSGTESLSPPDR